MADEKVEGLREEIEVSEGINVEMVEGELIMKKDNNEIKRKIHPVIDLKVEGNKIMVSCARVRKTEKKIFGSMKAHIRNMIKGLEEPFKYKLQISNVHFPMTVTHNKEKNELVVKNFVGEKTDRIVKLVEGVDVKTDKEFIELECHDREKAGQCAANIEKATKVRNKDRRIFQDGIFIIEKPGRKFL